MIKVSTLMGISISAIFYLIDGTVVQYEQQANML